MAPPWPRALTTRKTRRDAVRFRRARPPRGRSSRNSAGLRTHRQAAVWLSSSLNMIWSGVAGARRAPSAKGLACQYVRSRECARICQGARRRHGRSAQPRCSRGLWAVGSRVGWAACRQESRGCAQSTHGPSSHAKATNSASAVPGVGMMPMHGRHKLRSHASTGTDCNLTQWGVRWQPRPKRRCNPHLDVGRASTRRLTARKVPRGPSAHMGPSGGIRRGSRGSGESRNPPPAKGPAIAPN